MKPMEKYKEMFVKYLNQLKDEVKAYPNDGSLWKLSGDIKNTPGNLCLHICGNLKHNIGAIIGKTGYVRNRDAEFSRKNVPKNELLNEVDSTIDMISPVIDKLTDDDMKVEFPSDTFSQGGSIGLIILRVAAHMGYHLGQINYHRRLVKMRKE
jgi:hypothetical protein